MWEKVTLAFHKSFEQLKFGFRTQRTKILSMAVLLCVAFFIIKPEGKWWEAMTEIVSLATLGVALLVWIAEFGENWEQNLPKRLDVIYLHKGKPAFVCENATILSESDLRAMAQQMGAQIIGERFLQLYPKISEGRITISYMVDRYYKHYIVKIYLKLRKIGFI